MLLVMIKMINIILLPDELFSNSYVAFRCNSENEAISLLSFLKTKLANYLLSLRKVNQNVTIKTLELIPLPPLLYEDGTSIIWTNDTIDEYFRIERNMYEREENITVHKSIEIETCLAITKTGKQCSKKSKENGYCKIHGKNKKFDETW